MPGPVVAAGGSGAAVAERNIGVGPRASAQRWSALRSTKSLMTRKMILTPVVMYHSCVDFDVDDAITRNPNFSFLVIQSNQTHKS